jgi:mRNA-degrading endonuclease RelE of RelBE toxin-antitoxin system
MNLLTVIETAEFLRQAATVWTPEQHDAFVAWIAANPLAGDVVPGAQGARKVRWAASGRGKRGGSRVIYFTRLDAGAVLLITVYVKAERSLLSASEIKRIRRHEP